MITKLNTEEQVKQFLETKKNEPFTIGDFIQTIELPDGFLPSRGLLLEFDYYLKKYCVSILKNNESKPKEYYLYRQG